jgi:hypothetical protein
MRVVLPAFLSPAAIPVTSPLQSSTSGDLMPNSDLTRDRSASPLSCPSCTSTSIVSTAKMPDANSYWINRRPPGPAPESMKDQF